MFLGGKPLSLRWNLTQDIPMPFVGGMLVGSSGTCLVVFYSQRVALCHGLDLGKLNTWLAASSDGTQFLTRLDTGGTAHVFELAKGGHLGALRVDVRHADFGRLPVSGYARAVHFARHN